MRKPTMLNRTSRRYGARTLSVLIALVGFAVALSVHAVYSSKTADDDVKDSCKDFSIDGAGVLSATCNVWDSHEIVYDTGNYTIDLDAKVGYDGRELQYNLKGFSNICKDETVGLADDKLILKADCPLGGSKTKTVSIRIDDMIWNEGRGFPGGAHVSLGLHWRQARWSD